MRHHPPKSTTTASIHASSYHNMSEADVQGTLAALNRAESSPPPTFSFSAPPEASPGAFSKAVFGSQSGASSDRSLTSSDSSPALPTFSFTAPQLAAAERAGSISAPSFSFSKLPGIDALVPSPSPSFSFSANTVGATQSPSSASVPPAPSPQPTFSFNKSAGSPAAPVSFSFSKPAVGRTSSEQGKELIEEGKALYDDGDLSGALKIFERALSDFFGGKRPKLEQRIETLRREMQGAESAAGSSLQASPVPERAHEPEQQDASEFSPVSHGGSSEEYWNEPGRSKDWVR